ncbi:MAG: TIGR00282 family metallophosphoesterase [Bacilli bacterium]|nr:TIGR00282 family metallophosphoesterase [Bacilli bacterium]
MKVLFVGDIVGRVGRRMVKERVPYYVDKYKIDFVIANGENASHGKGLTKNNYYELIDAGVDVITLGNHYNSKSETESYIGRVDNLIRPINILSEYPGDGSAIYDIDGVSIRVTNVLGSAFINENVSSPYLSVLEVLEEEPATIHIVDFHAEATGEKKSFGYALDGKVSAVLGTHTHIQTRDYQIFPEGTAYISDVGMCGFADGVLGFTKESVMNRNLFGGTGKFQPPDEGRGLFSAVVMDFDDTTGKCKEIFPIYYLEDEK